MAFVRESLRLKRGQHLCFVVFLKTIQQTLTLLNKESAFHHLDVELIGKLLLPWLCGCFIFIYIGGEGLQMLGTLRFHVGFRTWAADSNWGLKPGFGF